MHTIAQRLYLSGIISGAAILDAAFLSAVPSWFDKRVNLATGLSFSGASVATIIGPLFILFFSDLYGVRGAFIMIAALWMQSFVLGALQRPSPKVVRPSEKETNHYDDKSEMIWMSDSSGISTIHIVHDLNEPEYVQVDFNTRKCKHDDEKVRPVKEQTGSRPSYIKLLRRPRVLRALVIVICGITGSIGKIDIFCTSSLSFNKIYMNIFLEMSKCAR